jgi:hypothetical protein
MSAGQESGSPIRENRTLLPAPLPPDEARGTLAAAAGVSTVGLRPPFDTPAAAFSSCLSRRSHLDCRARGIPAQDWTRCVLRDCTRGQLQVDIAHRRVWDGEEARARCWHLIVRREVKSVKTIKYSLSNAPADTPLLRLAQMQGDRYWVERAFEDAKGRVRPSRLSGAGLAILASPRHDRHAGDAVHRRTARGLQAEPRIADAARHRRDVERDPAAQTARKGRARRPHNPAARTKTRRDRIPLPDATSPRDRVGDAGLGNVTLSN